MRQQDVFASSQILVFSPILKENAEIKVQYFRYLKKLIRLVKWDKRKYTKAQLAFYKETLCDEDSPPYIAKENKIPVRMCYLMPYDLAIILAYHPKVIYTEKIEIIINKKKKHISKLNFNFSLTSMPPYNEINYFIYV